MLHFIWLISEENVTSSTWLWAKINEDQRGASGAVGGFKGPGPNGLHEQRVLEHFTLDEQVVP